MNKFRFPSVLLAALLHFAPLMRIAAVFEKISSPLMAIVFRWAAASSALLGSIQAVSGASTLITSPLRVTGTNGIPFSQRLTTSPDQAHYWLASGLPGGLTLQGTSGSVTWKIAGTPTVAGIFNVVLTAKDTISSGADRTVKATMVFTIVGNGTPPAISTQPQSQTVTAGSNVSLSVAATGTAPLAYQWKKNGADLAGRTNSVLTFAPAVASDTGSYTVQVSNSAGSILSQAAVLTVNVPIVPPSITVNPASVLVHPGEPVLLTVTASGTAPLAYQWFKDGILLAGKTSAALTLSAAADSDAGPYTVQVSNSAGSVTSDPATVSLAPVKISEIHAAAAGIAFSWSALPGRNYQVFSSPSPAGTWTAGQKLQASAGGSGILTVEIPTAGAAAQFFRVAPVAGP